MRLSGYRKWSCRDHYHTTRLSHIIVSLIRVVMVSSCSPWLRDGGEEGSCFNLMITYRVVSGVFVSYPRHMLIINFSQMGIAYMVVEIRKFVGRSLLFTFRRAVILSDVLLLYAYVSISISAFYFSANDPPSCLLGFTSGPRWAIDHVRNIAPKSSTYYVLM